GQSLVVIAQPDPLAIVQVQGPNGIGLHAGFIILAGEIMVQHLSFWGDVKKSIVFRCTHQGPIGENDQGKESRLGKQEFIDGIIVLSDNIRPPQFDQPVRKGSYPKVVPLVYQQRFYRDPYRLHGVPTPKIGAFEKSCLGIYLEESPVGSHIDLSIAVLLYGLDDQGWERTGFVHLYFFYLEIHRIEPVQALFKTPDIQFSQIVLLNGRDGDRVAFDAIVFQGDPFEA